MSFLMLRTREWAIIGNSLMNEIQNQDIPKKTKVGRIITKLKWLWNGHIFRKTDG